MGPASTRGYQLGGLGANEIQQEYLYMLVSGAGSSGPELKMLRQVTDAGPSLPWWLSPLVSAFL
ncbi:MAG: hypothetical protein JXP73_05470, partial [Deltaproteobacteria bacterium]|nr:hypothetical protein [Deltaproteobacteria bacterium]